MSSADDNPADTTSDTPTYQYPALVDWVVAGILAISGLILVAGGSILTLVLDRDVLQDGIESGQITVFLFERDLTQAEMLALALEVINWTGIGLLVTGIALVLFAIGYAIRRHRTHQATGTDDQPGSYGAFAVTGAVATWVLSFIPFSPVLGGGIAGYFEAHESERIVSVGAVSGLLAMAPGVIVLVFVAIGVYLGLAAVDATGLGITAGVALLIAVLFIVAYGAGLGALGGFVGGEIADD